MAPPRVEEICSKCGQLGHLAHDCRPVHSQNAAHPPVGRTKSNRNRRFRSGNDRPSAMSCGHVAHVKMEEARGAPKVVMGTLLVNSMPASILFDSGASHAFVSQ